MTKFRRPPKLFGYSGLLWSHEQTRPLTSVVLNDSTMLQIYQPCLVVTITPVLISPADTDRQPRESIDQRGVIICAPSSSQIAYKRHLPTWDWLFRLDWFFNDDASLHFRVLATTNQPTPRRVLNNSNQINTIHIVDSRSRLHLLLYLAEN